jgi:hypothetical protein
LFSFHKEQRQKRPDGKEQNQKQDQAEQPEIKVFIILSSRLIVPLLTSSTRRFRHCSMPSIGT